MGEYATVNGEQVKIGTCENMYYLRWDQCSGDANGASVGDYRFAAEFLAECRFRFPFPDEDGTPVGSFDRYDRGQRLSGDIFPGGLEHGLVQFKADNGYLVSLPCPEGPQGDAPYRVGRNGYGGPAELVQQAWRGGRLVGIARCRGCDVRFRLEDGFENAAAVSIRADADFEIQTADRNGTEGNREIGERLHVVADRLLAGYAV